MKTASVELFCQTPFCEAELFGNFLVPDRPIEEGGAEEIGRAVPCPVCETVYEVIVRADRDGYTAMAPLYPSAPVRIEVTDTSEVDWSKYEPPDEPINVFKEARADIDQVWELFAAMDWGHEAAYRMVFVQHFAILEAFLADTLIQLCYEDKGALLALVTEVDELSKAKIGLREILSSPGIVSSTVRDYLRDTQFHNLAKVDVLFQKAMKHSILPSDKAEKTWLFRVVAVRHDCVHRNGVDRDGTDHIGFLELVPKVAAAFWKMAMDLDDAICAMSLAKIAAEEQRAAEDDWPF